MTLALTFFVSDVVSNLVAITSASKSMVLIDRNANVRASALQTVLFQSSLLCRTPDHHTKHDFVSFLTGFVSCSPGNSMLYCFLADTEHTPAKSSITAVTANVTCQLGWTPRYLEGFNSGCSCEGAFR